MNTEKEIGYILRSGRIEFSTTPLEDHPGLPICPEYAEHPLYREKIETWARLAYDNKTLLVPGIPEAKSSDDALAAAINFANLIREMLADDSTASK